MTEKFTAKLVIEIDEVELAVAMAEANYGIVRPIGLSAGDALAAMDRDCRDGWKRSARVACQYFTKQIDEAMQAMQGAGETRQ